MTVRVAIAGASGRMGQLMQQVVGELDGYEVIASLTSASGVDEMNGADVLVDVTSPEVSPALVRHALGRGLSVLVGTSGWDAGAIAELSSLVAGEQAVIIIPNFSIGSVLGTHLATIAAPFFDTVEVIEAHHAQKVDSPSGTAVRTAEMVAAVRQDAEPAPYADQPARGIQISGIPVHSIRSKGVVAKQEVLLGGEGEYLTITHDTVNPNAYRYGIALALSKIVDAHGVTVGLDTLMGLTNARDEGML